MEAVEFEANIKNGSIEVPVVYQSGWIEGGKVRVILLKPDNAKALLGTDQVKVTISTQLNTAKTGLIAELIDNPIEIEDFVPLTREEAHDRNL